MRALPQRITFQIALLLVICILLFHAAFLSFVFMLGLGRAPPNAQLDMAAIAIAMLDSAPADQRGRLGAALDRVGAGLHVSTRPSDDRAASVASAPAAYLRSRLPAGVNVESALSGEGVRVALSDGQRISVAMGKPDASPATVVIASIAFLAVSLAVFCIWAVSSLTRPLTRFAQAAETFSIEGDPLPIQERGSHEIRAAARAFNRMQVRVSTMAAAQARTLAAISHDLRTPITRMRLRAEFIADEETRARTLRDLQQMDGMVHACLSYLQGSARRTFEAVDVGSLMQTVADQFAETGSDVTFADVGKLAVRGNPDDLLRALTNLADNAVRFTGSAELSFALQDAEVVLDVADRGPGLSPAAQELMLKPFERGDASRGSGHGEGYGLGLAITRAIAEAHGGSLAFADRSGGGLIARITLPATHAPDPEHGRARKS